MFLMVGQWKCFFLDSAETSHHGMASHSDRGQATNNEGEKNIG